MSETRTRASKFWGWVAGIVAGLIVAIVGPLTVSSLTSGQDSPERPPRSQVDEPASSAPSTTTTDPEPSTPDPAPDSMAGATPVTLEDSVSAERCARPGNTGFPWEVTSPNIAGTNHGSGFSCTIATDPAQGWVTFIVPEGASQLDVNAGQSLESTNTTVRLRFEVVDDLTGSVLERHEVSFGELAAFHTPVADVLRVSLRVTLLEHAGDFRKTSGDASWGDPTFLHQ